MKLVPDTKLSTRGFLMLASLGALSEVAQSDGNASSLLVLVTQAGSASRHTAINGASPATAPSPPRRQRPVTP